MGAKKTHRQAERSSRGKATGDNGEDSRDLHDD